ncbi:MAG: peroxiredoxin [Gammaproteobacteria bacterium]|nr:peroxiredoxin [Gammaproteobacteria bacterium]
MLKKGDRAPDFSLPDDSGNTVGLGDLLQKGPMLLYFYPAYFTPGCTKEACEIRDMHEYIADVGMTVVGISPQDSQSHDSFRSKYQLPFPLLADPDKQAVKAYGVDGPLGIGVRRATFIIGTDKTIEDVMVADFRIARHSDFIRAAVKRYRQPA